MAKRPKRNRPEPGEFERLRRSYAIEDAARERDRRAAAAAGLGKLGRHVIARARAKGKIASPLGLIDGSPAHATGSAWHGTAPRGFKLWKNRGK